MKQFLALLALLVAVSTATANTPPKLYGLTTPEPSAPTPPPAPKMYGMQDCQIVNGQMICPQPTRFVQRQSSNLFGLGRTVTRTRTVTPAPAMTPAEVSYYEEEVEIPVQKVVTVMEKRKVRKKVVTTTVAEPVIYQTATCPGCANCQPQYLETTSRTIQRSTQRRSREVRLLRPRSWFPRLRRQTSFSSGYIYPGDGKSVYSHLMGSPHYYSAQQLAGLSHQQLLQLHTDDHS